MAVRTRTLPTRRRSTRNAAESTARRGISYRSGRAAVALFLFALAFGLLWLINGSFTAQFVMAVSGTDATVGWSVHLIITAIEASNSPPIASPPSQ